jgi:hypothetical protein
MSKLTTNRWALPGFSILAAAVFITVHMTSGKWREAPNISDGEGFEKTLDTGREETGGGLNTDEGVRPFTYVPTSSPIEDNDIFVPVPTTIVLGHNIPQPGNKPSTSTGGGNNDKIPTLKWDIPPGEPTPDPALLYDPATPPLLLNKGERGEGKHGSAPPGYGQGDGSPANLKWNIPYVSLSKHYDFNYTILSGKFFLVYLHTYLTYYLSNYIGTTNTRSSHAY